MKFYFFSIIDGKINNVDKSPVGEPTGYTQANNRDIYYRLVNSLIAHVMCEAEDLPTATKAVKKFLLDFKK